jgi:hypothetical protein
VIAWKLPRTAQLVGIAAGKATTRVTILLDKLSPKAIRLDEAPLQTRAASGKTIVELKPGYQVLGLNVSWVVPRAVAGEKTTPEKEPEVPEEPEELQAPEVEQLSFGMIEPAIKVTPKVGKSKTHKPRIANKQKAKPVPHKGKVIKAEQATLITKVATPKKKHPDSKAGRPKSSTGGAIGKKKVTAKIVQAPLSDKIVPVEKSPAPKRGRPKSSTPITAKPTKTTTKTNKSKLRSKTTTGAKVKSNPKATKPVGKTKSTAVTVKKPAAKPAKPGKNTKSAQVKEKKPTAKVGRPGTVKNTKKRTGQTTPTKAQGGKSALTKSAARKKRQKKVTVKSASTPTAVLLPPSWKPTRSKSSPTRRIGKPTKPKSN